MIINLLFRIWILYSVQYFLSEKKKDEEMICLLSKQFQTLSDKT